jgi:hypothetical protein
MSIYRLEEDDLGGAVEVGGGCPRRAASGGEAGRTALTF